MSKMNNAQLTARPVTICHHIESPCWVMKAQQLLIQWAGKWESLLYPLAKCQGVTNDLSPETLTSPNVRTVGQQWHSLKKEQCITPQATANPHTECNPRLNQGKWDNIVFHRSKPLLHFSQFGHCSEPSLVSAPSTLLLHHVNGLKSAVDESQ